MTQLRPFASSFTLSLVALLFGLAALPACSGGDGSGGSGGGTGGSGGGTGATGGGGSGGSSPTVCSQGSDCDDDEYCHFADYGCGLGDAEGVCTPRPIECSHVPNQVCSCDGTVQLQNCPELGGVDIAANGACTPPQGTFACGYTFCATGTEYCVQVEHPQTDPGHTAFACGQLPAACNGVDDCSCVTTDPNVCPGATCDTDADGHAIVLCTG